MQQRVETSNTTRYIYSLHRGTSQVNYFVAWFVGGSDEKRASSGRFSWKLCCIQMKYTVRVITSPMKVVINRYEVLPNGPLRFLHCSRRGSFPPFIRGSTSKTTPMEFCTLVVDRLCGELPVNRDSMVAPIVTRRSLPDFLQEVSAFQLSFSLVIEWPIGTINELIKFGNLFARFSVFLYFNVSFVESSVENIWRDLNDTKDFFQK